MTGKGIDDMKLRYYLRGVGTGILVTAVLMGFALNGQSSSMTDEQIKQRATELGMVEERLLSDVAEEIQTEQETQTDPENKSDLSQSEENLPESKEAALEETVEPETTVKPETAVEPETTSESEIPVETVETVLSQPAEETIENGTSVQIEVIGGESSVSISKKLEEAGLIPSAKEYDQYLCDNGYDKKISVGKHEVPSDADYETIAKILTTK